MRSGLQVYEGCYPAARASALSGVALSTVYDWARKGVVIPSVSPTREKLWSYADLMALRIVAWLRRPKIGGTVPRSHMQAVRQALALLDDRGIDLWDESQRFASALLVDKAGRVVVSVGDELSTPTGQGHLADTLDLLAPFGDDAVLGPDLRRPRPMLRIVPGKCSGEPHVSGSRVTTRSIAALWERGYGVDAIAVLYPHEDREALVQALELETQLSARRAA